MNNVFFGKNGITSTEANFIANVAKEKCEASVKKLSGIKLYQVEMSSLDSEKKIMALGETNLDWINESLTKIGRLTTLIAWLREAIKEKDKQLEEIDEMDITEWLEKENRVMPEYPERPSRRNAITETQVREKWGIDKQQFYWSLEAFAATYGRYIHPSGSISKAREEAHKALSTPITKEGSGRDTILYYNTPTVPIELIDEKFLEYQNTYRSYERELNALKSEIKEAVSADEVKTASEYDIAVKEYKDKFDKISAQQSIISNDFYKWKTEQRNRISALKIVIPEALESIYKEIVDID
jgi:hypothetical protein